MPNIHALFTRYRLYWRDRALGQYSEELVKDFYASYVATLRSKIDRRAAPAKQDPLDHISVRGKQVDISLPAIRQYLYGEDVDATRTSLTADFKYRWKLVKDGRFLRDPELIETTRGGWPSICLLMERLLTGYVSRRETSTRLT